MESFPGWDSFAVSGENAMQLWLVRHAVAMERDEFSGPDEERPLTDKGRKQFREFADWLATQTATPTIVITSPLLRAAQTAEIFRKAFGLKKKDVAAADTLSPGAEPRLMLDLAQQSNGPIVALVGHEPDFGRALSGFVGGGAFTFGKGFVAAVEFENDLSLGSGSLQWFVGPKLK